MTRTFVFVLLLAFGFALPAQESQRSAPGKPYYIAARAKFVRILHRPDDPGTNEIHLRGTSNLPAGSLLSVHVIDFVGYQSHSFADEVVTRVDASGYFEAKVSPKAGQDFRPNLLCHVAFMPNDPRQPKDVTRLIGPRGEKLDIEHNPQVGRNRGGDYLELLVAAPR